MDVIQDSRRSLTPVEGTPRASGNGAAGRKPGNVAQLVVECLREEGVQYVFGVPGEENIGLVDALAGSGIRFVLVRHEQAAAFMAEIYGRLTGKAAVCTSTLGPGALNMLLGIADAQLDSTPIVSIVAQVGLNRIYKESHQIVDLVSVFRPVTKWVDLVKTPDSVAEMVRKAFDLALAERPGATMLVLPEDVEVMPAPTDAKPLVAGVKHRAGPHPQAIAEAAALIRGARRVIILSGFGVARAGASGELVALAETLNAPVATTYMGKGTIPARHPNYVGTVGFMRHDYVNFVFDEADLIIAVGYELQEFTPARINPTGDAKIIHIHRFAQDTDAAYQPAVNIESDIGAALSALTGAVRGVCLPDTHPEPKIRALLDGELEEGARDDSFPLVPARIIADTRKALGDDDILLVDTGALKMWAARLYPAQKPHTCMFSNALCTMAFTLPGALGAALACPDRKILAAMGDGAFLMNSQEIETAMREKIPLKVLIWEDNAYGLIKWKMDLELGHHRSVDFSNPDFVAYAESFGAKGYRVAGADALLPTLQKALAEPGVSIITVPVDYARNSKLTDDLAVLKVTL